MPGMENLFMITDSPKKIKKNMLQFKNKIYI